MAAIKHVLFPFDFSTQAFEVAPFVRAMALRLGAKVTVLSVVPPTWELPPEGMRPLVGSGPPEWTRALQDRLNGTLVDELRDIQTDRVADSGDPALRIVAFAGASHVDLVMMPTHGLGVFRRFLVGSVTSRVLHEIRCPVWTAVHAESQKSAELPQTILCAVDGSPATGALLEWTDQFRRTLGARLNVVHAVGPITDFPSLERERRLQEQVRDEARVSVERVLKSAGIDAPLRVAVGDTVDVVVEEATQTRADLVVIGRGTVAEPFGALRTHAFGIVERSPCPVLSV